MTEKSAPDNSYWSDKQRLLFNKDCRHMSELSDESVQMVVTSPPYWGLRKYAGLPDLIWGGDERCEHQWQIERIARPNSSGGKPSKTNPYAYKLATKSTDNYSEFTEYKDRATYTDTCSLCGAWKGQLGLEPSPELFISHLVEICREIRRVLRKDGVAFINIGDSYAGSGKGQNTDGSPGKSGKLQRSNKGTQVGGLPVSRFDKWNSDTANSIQVSHNTPKASYVGLKPKDLCLIPFRLAIALQEDGWWVRSVIIWSKNNPMPESVTDRPSESHEYILMLTKSARYFWDAEAVREPQKLVSIQRAQRSHDTPYDPNYPGGIHNHISDYYKKTEGKGVDEIEQMIGGRNLRSVWTFSTQSYKEAHFATYPEELVRRCVLAGTPEVGCCPNCGKAWARMIERYIPPRSGGTDKQRGYVEEGNRSKGAESFNVEWAKHKAEHPDKLLGWKAQCKCGLPQSENIGSLVLDCFAGSGTTLAVAKRLGRQSVGYELSEEYCKLAVKRIEKETAPMRGI